MKKQLFALVLVALTSLNGDPVGMEKAPKEEDCFHVTFEDIFHSYISESKGKSFFTHDLFKHLFDYLKEHVGESGKQVAINLNDSAIGSFKNHEYKDYTFDLSHISLFTDEDASELAKYNVVSLDLSHNYAVRLPNNFVKLKDLQVLNLTGAQLLTIDDLKIIAQLPSLRVLNLSYSTLYNLIRPIEESEVDKCYRQSIHFVVNVLAKKEGLTVIYPSWWELLSIMPI